MATSVMRPESQHTPVFGSDKSGTMLNGWLTRGLGAFMFNFKFLGNLGAIAQEVLVMGCIWATCYWALQARDLFKL